MTREDPEQAGLHARMRRKDLQDIIARLGEGVILFSEEEGAFWANAPALELHGVTDLDELGRSCADYRRRFQLRYRNNHHLADRHYPFDRFIAGETFEDLTVKVTRAGDGDEDDDWRRVFNLRGLALTSHTGTPECHVLVIDDMTERYTAEERFEKTFAANPAPAVISRLSDLRYVKVNSGFLGMTGYEREEVLRRTLYELDVLAQVPDRDDAIAKLSAGEPIGQTEALIKVKGGAKLVIVAGQPLEMSGEACMLFTFVDMEPRREAEAALRQSEERFARSFRMTPVPTFLSDLASDTLLDVNDAFLRMFGLKADDLAGRSVRSMPIWSEPGLLDKLVATVGRGESVLDVELCLRTGEGGTIDCLASAEALEILDRRCMLLVLQDITERKRSEAELIAAIDAVMQDTTWFSRSIIEKLANHRRPAQGNVAASAGLTDLTPRELDVLALLGQGLSDDEIAAELALSRNTVRNHVSRLYGKLDVHNRAAAVIWARERGVSGRRPPKPPGRR